MASSTRYTCGSCKKRIGTETHTLFYPIGVPYIKCAACGTVNVRASQRNEWDLMTWELKVRCFVEVAFLGVFVGLACGAAVSELGKEKLGVPLPGSVWFVFWPLLGALMGVVAMSYWLKADIRRSRKRLVDEEYVETLVRFGIVSSSPGHLRPEPTVRCPTDYDRDVREIAREQLLRLHGFADKHRNKLPNWSKRSWTVIGLGVVAFIYALSFSAQSIRAEHECLQERHAAAYYVSPWTLTRYCTMHSGGREYTFDAGTE
jgi:LSD1 subclass zinc finger protein